MWFFALHFVFLLESHGCCGVNCSKSKLVSDEVLYKQAEVKFLLSRTFIWLKMELLELSVLSCLQLLSSLVFSATRLNISAAKKSTRRSNGFRTTW